MKTIGIDISVLNDSQKTGIGVYAYQLIDALLKINHQDKFILFGIATFSTYNFLKNLPFKNYPNVEMKIFKLPAKSFRLAFLAWQKLNWPKIEDLIGKVDIFHSFNWFMPPQKYGKKVATVFDLTSVLYPKWHMSKTSQLDQARFKKITTEADLVIAISKNSKKDFLKLKPKGKVEIIYPASSGELNYSKHTLAKHYLAVSTIEPRKNYENLINAYLKADLKEPLIIVGKEGWKSEKVMKLIKDNYPKVKHFGFVSNKQLVTLYQQAKVFIYPSFYEGFGIPVLEAMKMGVPVICSNTSSLPEVVGKAAILVNPESVEDIAQGLKRMMNNEERIKLIKAGLKQAKKFSWEQSAKKLNFLYQQILDC